MSFKEFFHEHTLKIKATSNVKIFQFISYLPLCGVKINLGDGPFSSGIGIGNLHASKGTYWFAYFNQDYFDSCGCSPPNKLSRFFRKRNGNCFFLKIQYKVGQVKRLFSFSLLFIYDLFEQIYRKRF